MLTSLLLISALAGADAVGATKQLAPPPACCEIVELRQYMLHPGRREAFIPYFEREFIETQEVVGNTVIGQFRDLDNPDHFTWLRGFGDMPQRAAALQAFYGGEIWKAHRDAANAFFIDTDNVLLLHALQPKSALDLGGAERAPPGSTRNPPGLLVATIYTFAAPVDAHFVAFFERQVRQQILASGIDLRGYYASETAANNFPRLPVREKDHVFVWFAMYKDADDYERHRNRLDKSPGWRAAATRLQHETSAPTQVLRLAPTPRSRLHG